MGATDGATVGAIVGAVVGADVGARVGGVGADVGAAVGGFFAYHRAGIPMPRLTRTRNITSTMTTHNKAFCRASFVGRQTPSIDLTYYPLTHPPCRYNHSSILKKRVCLLSDDDLIPEVPLLVPLLLVQMFHLSVPLLVLAKVHVMVRR